MSEGGDRKIVWLTTFLHLIQQALLLLVAWLKTEFEKGPRRGLRLDRDGHQLREEISPPDSAGHRAARAGLVVTGDG